MSVNDSNENLREVDEIDKHNMAHLGIPTSANTVGPTGSVIILVVTADQKQTATKMRLLKRIGWVAVSKTYH